MLLKCFLKRFLGVFVMADIGERGSSLPTHIEQEHPQPHEEGGPTMEPSPENNAVNVTLKNFILYELRRDQTRKMLGSVKNKNTWIVGPSWMTDVLRTLDLHTNHIQEVHVTGKAGTTTSLLQGAMSFVFKGSQEELYTRVELPKQMNFFKLQVLARNEAVNVDGYINQGLYNPGLSDLTLIMALKDLVRQTVIVGEAMTTKYGGYRTEPHAQSARVFICDLAALQFQDARNSGRLVLIPQGHTLQCGLLDDRIFQEVVHEPKKSYKEASKQVGRGERFVPVQSRVFGPVLFDTVAYKRFVASDFVLAGLAIEHAAARKGDKVQFKFLKYGTGFFAGEFSKVIEANILEGVLDGIERLFMHHQPKHIKAIELPFYSEGQPESRTRVAALSSRFSVPITISQDDALKVNARDPGLVLATTNCGDPHAVFGNEMGYSSVDAAIAENLKDKGAGLCPLILQGPVGEVVIQSKI